MLIGYARVSTKDQNLDAQIDALKKAGCTKIFSEKISGVREDRKQLTAALEFMREGDVLVVTRLDRLGRSLKQLVATIENLENQNINFKCLDFGFDTSSTTGKLVFQIFAALAEFERNLISDQTKAGLKAAVARGRKGGRPKVLNEKNYPAALALLRDPNIPVRQAAKTMGVSVATLYRHFPDGKRSK